MNSDQLLAPLKALIKSLGPAQTAVLALVFLAVVGVIAGSAYWMSVPTYTLLASDLDAESASSIVGHLKDAKVPFELTDGGRSIRVPAEHADELRLEFAGTGLPSAGRIGFEIFDRPAFGTTEFLEQVNFRRALEGELARTIGTLSDVTSARVHIAMAKDSLFLDKAEAAKASVVLKLKNNRPLAPSTVKAITGLVAASVESLRPEAVVVLDTFGRSLTQSAESGDESASAVGLDRQQRIERDMGTRVIALLEPVVGAGHVRVNVSARLKADAEDITEEHWDPASVVRSKQTTTEADSRSNPQGAAGARANMPPNLTTSPSPTLPSEAAAAAATAAATLGIPAPGAAVQIASGTTHSSETTNYEVGKLTRHSTSPSGQLARLSVAVILDEDHTPAKDGGAPAAKPRAPEELQRIQHLVSAAVGFDESRGDQLTVDSIPFETVTEIDTAPAPAGWGGVADEARSLVREQGMSALRLLGIGIVAIVAIFGFLRPMGRRALATRATATAAAALPATSPTALPGRPPTIQELEGRFSGDADSAADTRNKPLLARRVAKLASEEPEYVARIMRTWLTEEDQ